MSTHELLAAALREANEIAKDGVLKGTDIDRGSRERLLQAGCLTEVIRGWYLLNSPLSAGNSTVWFAGVWSFLRHYLADRFGETGYCLSAESSIDVHTGESSLSQLIVLTEKPSNQSISLPQNTSLLIYMDAKNFPTTLEKYRGVNSMPIALALSRLTPNYFKTKSLNAEIALKMLPALTDVSRILLAQGSISAANRIAGAYLHLGDAAKSEQIFADMQAAGYAVTAENPFEKYVPGIQRGRIKSPYSGRVEALWHSMRPVVIAMLPAPRALPLNAEGVLRDIHEKFREDAYHSLSIEGYRVTEELIEKISQGNWAPLQDRSDMDQRDAMAARGYFEASKSVISSIHKVIDGKNAGVVFAEDLQTWYRNLFSSGVLASLVKPEDLAGYRNTAVYIEGARHVPPSKDGVLDAMEMLFELLRSESHPGVRAILGHFIFVYIHPYLDGNGRIGRFLMNLMLASGGYPWTIIRVSERSQYMEALDAASAYGNIQPFAALIAAKLKS